MIKIFLTDDHEMVRQGIRALLEREPYITFADEAGSGRETLSKLTVLKPDLLLLDLLLPDISGMETLEKAKKAFPDLRVIILSMYDNKIHLMEALQRGADGYVIKGSSGLDLLKAIRTVMAGRRYVSPMLAEYLVEDMATKRPKGLTSGHERLTLREEEVLYYTAEGLSSTEIAAKLGISSRTVEAHRNNLMKKLDLHNKAELIRYSMEKGILKRQ